MCCQIQSVTIHIKKPENFRQNEESSGNECYIIHAEQWQVDCVYQQSTPCCDYKIASEL